MLHGSILKVVPLRASEGETPPAAPLLSKHPNPDWTFQRIQQPGPRRAPTTHLGDVHDFDGRQLSRLDMSTLQGESKRRGGIR